MVFFQTTYFDGSVGTGAVGTGAVGERGARGHGDGSNFLLLSISKNLHH